MALFTDTFTGDLAPVGEVVGEVQMTTEGGLAPSGVVVFKPLFSLAGTITPAGIVVWKVAKTLAGSITPAGVVAASEVAGSGLIREVIRINALFKRVIRIVVNQED